MKLSEQDKEFFESMEIGLREELKRAKERGDSAKFDFIKGQLDMLRKIKDRDENQKPIKLKY